MRISIAKSLLALTILASLDCSVLAQIGNPNVNAASVPPAGGPGVASPNNPSSTTAQPAGAGQIVRDPVTGRMFYQQWITETVPATRWEYKQITTTVYETQWVNQVVPTSQTVYQPQTQYVLQPVWKGAWNPFRQPTLAYQSKPVTDWRPTTVTVNQVVTIQKVVPKQQTITVPQPVTETKTQQRLVQTEIHQPSLQQGIVGRAQPVMIANQPPALFRLPLLARGPMAYPPQHGNYSPSPIGYVPQTNTNYGSNGWVANSNPNQGALVQSALRPITRLGQTILPTTYNVPLHTATRQGGNWNAMQSGMPPTVLR